MARAFLSTGAGHHPVDGSRYTCGFNVESALSEARAILAETEDDNGHADPVSWPRIRDERPFPDGPVGTYGWERYGFDSAFWSRDSRAALAESLAAFVEA